jgi:hypothetical protein
MEVIVKTGECYQSKRIRMITINLEGVCIAEVYRIKIAYIRTESRRGCFFLKNKHSLIIQYQSVGFGDATFTKESDNYDIILEDLKYIKKCQDFLFGNDDAFDK